MRVVCKSLIPSLNVVLSAALVFAGSVVSQPASAFSHAYINQMRSGAVTHVFVSQGVEGEYGVYRGTGDTETVDLETGNTVSVAYPGRQMWKGYGFKTTMGLELLKFVEFGVSHTFVNMRSQENSWERLTGSRLSADGALVFGSPIGNLRLGGGFLGSRLDYQKRLESSDFYGSGIYYSIGMNYFLSSRVSLYGNMGFNRENLVRNGGSSVVRSIQTESTTIGCGFSLWL